MNKFGELLDAFSVDKYMEFFQKKTSIQNCLKIEILHDCLFLLIKNKIRY